LHSICTAKRVVAIVIVAGLIASGCAESFRIKSYPAGSKAYVDGQLIGTTPANGEIPRSQVGLPHTWRVEFRNCDAAEGKLQTGIAGGRIVGYIFTAGILAAFRGPHYYRDVDAVLTGGDCEGTAHVPSAAPQPGILIQNIVGDKNQATTSGSSDLSKTQQLNERLTTLRDLYNRKLISRDVFEQESQKAIRESE
jgi:hypothetical protein